MADFKRETDDLATRAALAAGKDAAKRLAEGLSSGDEESSPKGAQRPAAPKSRRNKRIAVGIFGLLAVLGVLGLVASYWHWFLLLGALGLVGLYGWHRLRKRLASKGKPDESARSKAERRATQGHARTEAREEAAGAPHPPERKRVELAPERPAADSAARESEQAIEEQEIEDELAALKARLDK